MVHHATTLQSTLVHTTLSMHQRCPNMFAAAGKGPDWLLCMRHGCMFATVAQSSGCDTNRRLPHLWA
jgi:hypothetical protein